MYKTYKKYVSVLYGDCQPRVLLRVAQLCFTQTAHSFDDNFLIKINELIEYCTNTHTRQ